MLRRNMAHSAAFRAVLLLIVLGCLAATTWAQASTCPATKITNTTLSGCTVCPNSYSITMFPGASSFVLPLNVIPGGSQQTTADGLVRIDIMLMLDTISANNNYYSALKNKANMDAFFARFGPSNGYTDPRVGFSVCDTTGTTWNPSYYVRRCSLSQNSADVVASVTTYPNPSVSNPFTPECIAAAMNDINVGWRPNAFRVVAFISDIMPILTYNLTNDILAKNIVPLFYMSTPTQAVYTAVSNYAASLPIAFLNYKYFANNPASTFNSWEFDVYFAINKTTQSISFGRTSDLPLYDSFILAIPPTTNLTLGQSLYTNVTLGYPTGLAATAVPNTFVAEVTAYGFGFQSYFITVVQPPTSSNRTYSTVLQGTTQTLTPAALNPSNLTTSIVFTSNPDGSVIDGNGNTVALRSPFALVTGYSLTYVPNPTFFGTTNLTFYLTDGCQNSTTYWYFFNFTKANQPPVASGFSVFIPYNTRIASEQTVNFTTRVSDPTDLASTLSIVITSLPSPTAGILRLPSGVAVTTPYTLGTSRTLLFEPTLYYTGSTTFNYNVTDGSLWSNDNTVGGVKNGVVTVVVQQGNTAPTLANLTATSFYVSRGDVFSFTVSATDPDALSSVTLMAVALGSGVNSLNTTTVSATSGMTLTSASALNFTMSAVNSAPRVFTVTVTVSSITTVFETPQTFSLAVVDNNGAYSNIISYAITVKTPPVSCPVGYYTTDNRTCTACLAGQSSTGGTTYSCFDCNAGQYSTNATLFVCTNCPAGTNSTAGSTSCSVCPCGTTSTAGSALCQTSCGANQYSNSTSLGVCTPCPAGYISPVAACTCQICPSGTFQSSTSCQPCSAGQTSTAGSTSCTACSFGTYSNSTTSGICQTCPASYITNTAQSGCIQCLAGFYPNITTQTCDGCPVGTSSLAGVSSIAGCTRCPITQVSSSATGYLCQTCSAGSVPDATQASCVNCLAGTYSNGSTCLLCSDGTTSADRATTCTLCGTGTYSNATTAGICTACPVGQIPNTPVQNGCQVCPAGYFQSGASCLMCSAGSTSTAGSTTCTTCPSTQYSNSTTLGICRSCPAGQIVSVGQIGCTVCDAGTFQATATVCQPCYNGTSSTVGSVSCTQCGVGDYSTATTSYLCTDCPAGTVTNVNQSACINCAAGTYDNGANSCVLCGAGNTSTGRATTCTPCSPLQYSNSTTAGICFSCPAGQIVNATQSGCTVCAAGTYQSGGACLLCANGYTSTAGSTTCTLCPVGTYSNSSTAGDCQTCPPGQVPSPSTAPFTGCVACSLGYYQSGAVCVPCPDGNTTTSTGQTACTACLAGNYSTSSTSHLCSSCQAGYYANVPTKNGCTICPSGYTSTAGAAGNASSCTPCPFDKYSNTSITNGLCQSCPAGYIPAGASGGSGNTTCAQCLSGSYQQGTICVKCPDGASSPAGSFSSAQCSNCTIGQYANASTGGLCVNCPTGQYSAGDHCEYCPAGTTAIAGWSSSPTNCTACPADQYSTTGICTTCPPGQVPTSDKTGCENCRAGFYESSPNGTCTRCPDGTTSDAGASDISQCRLCDLGQTSTAASSGSCVNCTAGSYSNDSRICVSCPIYQRSDAGSSSCTNCSAGYYVSGNECLMCSAGTTSTSGSTSCTSCDPTQYSNATTAGICKSCPAGMVPNSPALDGCTACPIGQYEYNDVCLTCVLGYETTTAGQIECTLCQDRYVSTVGICTLCPVGEIGNANRSACEACPSGTKQVDNTCANCDNGQSSVPGSTNCFDCTGINAYSNSTTNFQCTTCPPGYVAKADKSGCDICAAGTYQSGALCIPCRDATNSSAGSTFCTQCPTGYYSNSTQAGICLTCPNYYVVNAQQTGCQSCPAGQIKLTETTCAPCTAGTSSTGSGPCQNCPAGQYASVSTNYLCANCSAGYYSTDASCALCPNGTTSVVGTADDVTQCTRCPDGQISNPSTNGLCQSCLGGYITNANQSTCVACVRGTYQYNATYCQLCTPGTSSSAGAPSSSSCTPCAAGQYSNSSTSGICFTCPEGQYSTGGSCEICPPGTTANGTASGSGSCTQCGTDRYSNITTGGICTVCGAGAVPVPNQDGCAPCPAGTYESAPGVCTYCSAGNTSPAGSSSSAQCTPCAAGEFSSPSTQGLCQPCPAGTYALAGTCVACPAGTISTGNAATCTNCDAGSYSNSTRTGCELCPNGTSSTAGTAGSALDCSKCQSETYSNIDTRGLCYSCPDGYLPNGAQVDCIRVYRNPVIVDAPGNVHMDQGSTLSFNISATDRDVDEYLTMNMSATYIATSGPMTWKLIVVDTITDLSPPEFLDAAQNKSIFTISFTPAPEFYGSDFFRYFARDPRGLTSNDDTVRITVDHINHQPTSSSFAAFGFENRPFVITSFDYSDVLDILAGDVYSLRIVTTPSRGWLQSDGSSPRMVVGDVLTKNNGDGWSVRFYPDPDTYDEFAPYTTFDFQICDDSGDAATNCSATQTVTVYISPVNHAPWSTDFTAQVDQNGNVSITFPAFDADYWDSYTASAFIISNPANFFTDPECTVPVASSVKLASNAVYYKPPRNQASFPETAPFTTLQFYVVDGNDTYSTQYTLSIVVNPILQPPEYKGSPVENVLENQPTDLLLSLASRFDNWNQGFTGTYITNITQVPTRGSLAICDLLDVCTWISEGGRVYDQFAQQTEWPVTHPNGRIRFLSDLNSFGANYTYIIYTVTDNNGMTATVNMTINVVHINQRPFIGNITWSDNSLVMNESGAVVFRLRIMDVDSVPSDLKLKITTRLTSRFDWNLYLCSDDAKDSLGPRDSQLASCSSNMIASSSSRAIGLNSTLPTSEATSTCNVPYGSPVSDFSGCYREFIFQFVPVEKRYSYQFMQLQLSVIDQVAPGSNLVPAESEVSVVYVGVLPINDAPTITAPARITPAQGIASALLVHTSGQSIVVADSDATRASLETLTVEYVDGVMGEFVSSSGSVPCTANTTDPAKPSWSCTGTILGLNNMLKSARWNMVSNPQPADGAISKLRFTINDNGATSVESAFPLSASIIVDVEYRQLPAAIVTPPQDNGILTIVAIVAALLAVLIVAIIVWRMRASLKVPNDDYFSLGTSSIATAPENPLFKAATKEGFNKMYRGKDMQQPDPEDS